MEGNALDYYPSQLVNYLHSSLIPRVLYFSADVLPLTLK